MGGLAQHGGDAAGFVIGRDEGFCFDAVAAVAADCEGSIVFLDVDRFGVAVAGQPCGELIGRVRQPRIGEGL